MPEIYLVPITKDGSPTETIGDLSETAQEVCTMTAKLYERAGFNEPWIGYFAQQNSQIIGTCAFTSAPVDGRVEIAYFTFPGFEGQGFATQMASKLIEIAGKTDPKVLVFANTLPEPNASNSILKKLGFSFTGSVNHPEDGEVWSWELFKEVNDDTNRAKSARRISVNGDKSKTRRGNIR